MIDSQNSQRPSFSWPAAIFLTAALLLLTWIAFQDIQQALAANASTQVVGMVNDQEITLLEFQNEMGLQAVRNVLRNQGDAEINQAVILNRMIGDALFLQAAQQAGVGVEDVEVEDAIDMLLGRYGLSRQEFDALLQEQNLDWTVFKTSIRDYLTILRFVDEVVLKDVAPADQQIALQTWMAEHFEAAELDFDQDFLDKVNGGG